MSGTRNRSACYWLLNPPRHVYCDMEQRVECGNIGGWTRIAIVSRSQTTISPHGAYRLEIISACSNRRL